MSTEEITAKLMEKGLRVTPQRVAVFEALFHLDNHPTAENIIGYIKKKHPNVSTGTIYKVLDSFVENKLLKKVKTENGTMRYDPVLLSHHHLYCAETDKIVDYKDPKLDELLQDYFQKAKIKNFKIQDINLQLTGIFKD